MKKLIVISFIFVLLIASNLACVCVGPDFRVVDEGIVTDCYGDLIPCADYTYSLGDDAHHWHNLYVENIIGWAPPDGGGIPSGLTDVRLVDEFLGGCTTSGCIGELGWLRSSGSFYGYDGSTSHPGIVKLGNSYSVPSVNTLYLGACSTIARTVIPQDIAYMALVMTPDSYTDHLAVRFGLQYLTSATQETSEGIYFSYDSTVGNKWRAVTRDGAGITVNNTSRYYSNGTWYLLEIIQSGSNYQFWINGVMEDSHSTNIPTIYCTPVIAFEILAGGNNVQNMMIDYFEMRSISPLGARYP